MVQVAGKYEIVKNENFLELLLKIGIPEDQAKAANELKSVLEVIVDGNKVQLISQPENHIVSLVLNEEVDEKMQIGVTAKSTATLKGNVLTISSKGSDGKSGTRTLTVSETGAEMKIAASDGLNATRIYKRV